MWVPEKDKKRHREEEVNPRYVSWSLLSSLLLLHCSSMKISAAVMNRCSQWRLITDLMMFVWSFGLMPLEFRFSPDPRCSPPNNRNVIKLEPRDLRLKYFQTLSSLGPASFQFILLSPVLAQYWKQSNSQITQIMFPILMRGSEPELYLFQ